MLKFLIRDSKKFLNILGNTNLAETKLVAELISRKVLLEENNSTAFNVFKNKLNVFNMPLYYFIANNFNMTKLCILSFSLIERCFTMLADSQSFLELDSSWFVF